MRCVSACEWQGVFCVMCLWVCGECVCVYCVCEASGVCVCVCCVSRLLACWVLCVSVLCMS